jgi:hypothetical protein
MDLNEPSSRHFPDDGFIQFSKWLLTQARFKKEEGRKQKDEDKTTVYRRLEEDASEYLFERRKDRSR